MRVYLHTWSLACSAAPFLSALVSPGTSPLYASTNRSALASPLHTQATRRHAIAKPTEESNKASG
jgi:hypothetical protein